MRPRTTKNRPAAKSKRSRIELTPKIHPMLMEIDPDARATDQPLDEEPERQRREEPRKKEERGERGREEARWKLSRRDAELEAAAEGRWWRATVARERRGEEEAASGGGGRDTRAAKICGDGGSKRRFGKVNRMDRQKLLGPRPMRWWSAASTLYYH